MSRSVREHVLAVRSETSQDPRPPDRPSLLSSQRFPLSREEEHVQTTAWNPRPASDIDGRSSNSPGAPPSDAHSRAVSVQSAPDQMQTLQPVPGTRDVDRSIRHTRVLISSASQVRKDIDAVDFHISVDAANAYVSKD